MMPSADLVAAAALQNKFPHLQEFSRNPGIMPKTYTHVLPTSGKYMARGPVKKLWGVLREHSVDRCLLLTVK